MSPTTPEPGARRALGAAGERCAAEYLARRGYRVVAHNVRAEGVELDLVALRAGTCVFVEVKTRRGAGGGTAEEAVDARKRERLGLADGSVTNRFWLWSVSSLGGFLADVALIPLVLSGTDLTKDSSPQLVVALSALLNAACWFLAFAPPPAYSRWLEARQARA